MSEKENEETPNVGEFAMPEVVDVNGHKVDAHLVERFFDGESGDPITDDEWDESKARLVELESDPDAVTWEILPLFEEEEEGK